jgi:DNA-directed RNA polymerase specialized sigma24 family protein
MVSLSQLPDHGDSPLNESAFYPSAPCPQDEMNLKMDIERLLSPAEQELLRLDLEGLTHREIGTEIGVSEGAVRSRLFRLRDKLRRAGVNSNAAHRSGERHE